MKTTFELADSFDATEWGGGRLAVDLTAPLPLGYREALKRGLALRAKGAAWSYTVISVVMAEYHGFRRSAYWWHENLRDAGVPPRPLGRPYEQKQAA